MNHWPTEEEIAVLQQKEYQRAELQDDEADPICSCGEPGWACRCEELAEKLGYWFDGSPCESSDEGFRPRSSEE